MTAVDWGRLRYIQLRGDGSKLPARKWGGYSQDFDEAAHVYTHEDVEMHPAESWGIVDVESPPHSSFALLIFDIDIHKAPSGFDSDRLGVPGDTLVTRSQNGGFHIYFVLNGYERGALQESDFQLTADPGFDIDIRGSVVSHHVVAPTDIPGVGSQYEIVNDAALRSVFEPKAAAERITLDGEPLLEFDPDDGVEGYDFDVPAEPPEEMPRCYHAGLELRKVAPDDHPNTHKVNVLTAACGLAAGYDPEEVAAHFCGEWAPRDGDVDLSDKDTTEYQVRHIHENGYSPPAESTLRDYGILDEGEHCEGCPIEYHGAGTTDARSDDVKHTAVLPPSVRDFSEATSGWDWRHTAEMGEDTLTLQDGRDRTSAAIADAYESGDRVLIEALPTMGKSYGAVKAAAETDEPVTILTTRGNVEQYGQLRQWCDEHGLTHYTLPSFTRDCDTANGEHGAEWKETAWIVVPRGRDAKKIHKSAEYHLGRPLPCQEHEGQQCPLTSAWDFDPDEYDVLIGHYAHAHKTKVTANRTVVFDEFADAYETQLGGRNADAPLQGPVSYWLAGHEGVPFDDYTDLIENRGDEARRADALLWLDEHGVEPEPDAVFEDASAHADAPLAVYTLLTAEDLENGWEATDLPDGGRGAVNRADGGVSLLRSPPLFDAPPSRRPNGVVALDGTPTKQMWELALGTRLNHRAVLQPEERAEYIREALNLNLVRTTEYIKPYNSEGHVHVREDAALLEEIGEVHGDRPALITTSTAEDKYREEGVDDLVSETKHYGNVLGSNEYDDTRLGAVIGSNHYGDGHIKKWGAYAGEAVERNDGKGKDLSYGPFGDRVLGHMREHDTLQAAMRFGRDGNGAVVYVHTDTLPDWVPTAAEARILRTRSDGERAVVRALEAMGEATTEAVVEHSAVDLSRSQVFRHLESFRERGAPIIREQDPTDGRRVVWRDDGLHRVNEHGDVDLEPVELEDLNEEEVRCIARSSIYTWDATSSGAEDAGSPGGPSLATTDPVRAPADGSDRPPDDPRGEVPSPVRTPSTSRN